MLKHYFIQAKKRFEAEGFLSLLLFLIIGAQRRIYWVLNWRRKSNHPAKRFQIVLDHPHQLQLEKVQTNLNLHHMTLNWLIPDFDIGSGGHMTLFRISELLQKMGHRNILWVYGDTRFSTGLSAKSFINKNFLPYTCEVKILKKNFHEVCGDVAIATDCWSVYPLRSVTKVRAKAYFIQDYESLFRPRGTEYFLTENTYREGLEPITAGKWLKEVMKTRFQAKAAYFDLAYDADTYRQLNQIKRIPRSIAFYSRQQTARRAVELGLLALEELHKMNVSFQVEFYGGSLGKMRVPYAYNNHGVLNSSQLANLYNKCQLGMVFSATNYSLVPQEMMACGLPVLELDGENTRAIFPKEVICLAPPNPHDIARLIAEKLANPKLLESQANAALEYVSVLKWERSACQVEDALKNILLKLTKDQDSLCRIN